MGNQRLEPWSNGLFAYNVLVTFTPKKAPQLRVDFIVLRLRRNPLGLQRRLQQTKSAPLSFCSRKPKLHKVLVGDASVGCTFARILTWCASSNGWPWLRAFASGLTPAISRLPKPDARPLPRLLRNELHPGGLQGLLNFPDRIHGSSNLHFSRLQPSDRSYAH